MKYAALTTGSEWHIARVVTLQLEGYSLADDDNAQPMQTTAHAEPTALFG